MSVKSIANLRLFKCRRYSRRCCRPKLLKTQEKYCNTGDFDTYCVLLATITKKSQSILRCSLKRRIITDYSTAVTELSHFTLGLETKTEPPKFIKPIRRTSFQRLTSVDHWTGTDTNGLKFADWNEQSLARNCHLRETSVKQFAILFNIQTRFVYFSLYAPLMEQQGNTLSTRKLREWTRSCDSCW